MSKYSLPQSVKNAIWWQNAEKIDTEKDAKMLIKAILQKGNFEAMMWMKKKYPFSLLQSVFLESYETEFSPKTLNFWKVVLHTTPKYSSRTEKILSL